MKFPEMYAAACDNVRGMEPRVREYMPAVRTSDGRECAVITRNAIAEGGETATAHELARLFAAAPAMLAALRTLLVHEHAVAYALELRPETRASWLEACTSARTAIDAAEGR